MTPFYLDTGVFLAAASANHPQRAAAQALIKAVAASTLPANISTEVAAEVLHVSHWRHDRANGATLVHHLRILFPHPLVIDLETLDAAGSLVKREPRLGIRAAIHGACLQRHGFQEVVSTDSDLGYLPGIRRWDPQGAATAWRIS